MAPRIILSLLGKYNFPHAYHHSLAYMKLSNDPGRPKAVHLFKFMFYWCVQRELRPGKVNQSFFFFSRLPLALRGVGFSHPFIPTFYSCRPLFLPFPLLSPLKSSHCCFSHFVVVFFLPAQFISFLYSLLRRFWLSLIESWGATPALITSCECSCLGMQHLHWLRNARCREPDQSSCFKFHQFLLHLMFMYFFFPTFFKKNFFFRVRPPEMLKVWSASVGRERHLNGPLVGRFSHNAAPQFRCDSSTRRRATID